MASISEPWWKARTRTASQPEAVFGMLVQRSSEAGADRVGADDEGPVAEQAPASGPADGPVCTGACDDHKDCDEYTVDHDRGDVTAEADRGRRDERCSERGERDATQQSRQLGQDRQGQPGPVQRRPLQGGHYQDRQHHRRLRGLAGEGGRHDQGDAVAD